ncbi:MAG: aminotransferase class V-fold PLP-dependent enzyme, partial [Candidatus Micrarchaeota archaeon]
MANMLLIPGPVELTDDIKLAQGGAMINHRSTDFGALNAEITQNLVKMFKSQEAYVITGSGTAAIESIIASVVKPDDRMLCLANGFFGDRFCATAKIYCKVVEEKKQWGTGFSIERAKDAIDNSDANVLGMVYNDTSTGVANHIRDICLYAKKNGMYTLIDAVSAWGGHPVDVNAWGIDALAAGSQKCLGAPPGLSMVALSADGVGRVDSNAPRTYYLDLKKYREYG